MLIVKLRKNENINSALKRFKRKFKDTGVINLLELKERLK
jgi:ribosomal protein S21